MRKLYPSIFFTLLLLSCSSQNEEEKKRHAYHQGDYIYRKHNETTLSLAPPQKQPQKSYSWDKTQVGNHPQITKEHFRCKGSTLNPTRLIQQKEGPIHWQDCGGVEKHSLPLKDNKEFVFPILLDLLNFIQKQTGHKVVITCGHRCPTHNTYADETIANQSSKHMIGAEIDFYVQGLEEQPEAIVQLIQQYYNNNPTYTPLKDYKEYSTFKRYDKSDTNVSIQPWYNKEIFVKIFNKNEGRDFDNRHPFPYISIQVRYDKDTNEKINYSWDKAQKNYLRW